MGMKNNGMTRDTIMNFTTKTVIQRWGNSQEIRLSKEIFYKRPIDEIYVESTQEVDVGDQAKMLYVGAGNAQFKEECPEDIWNEARELIISFM